VLRKIFGSKREEIMGGWRRINNWKLHDLYASTNIIRVIKPRTMMRREGNVECMGEMKNAYKILVGKPEGKISLGRSRRR